MFEQAGVDVDEFGLLADGRKVESYTLRNQLGMSCTW
jgi:hypothetical protein